MLHLFQIIINILVFNPLSFSTILALIILFIFLFFSAIISASETAFFSLTPAEYNILKSKHTKSSDRVLKLLSKPKHLIATILVANNFVNVTIVILSAFIINNTINFGDNYILEFIVQTIIITAIILLTGEIMPKIYSSYNALKFANFVSGFISVVSYLFKPVSNLLVMTTFIPDRRIKRKGFNISIPELSKAIEITSSKAEDEEEQNILKGIINFGDIEVSEIMRSRMDIAAVEDSINFEELLKFVLDAGYSRIPVYRDNLDRIIGILYIKDLLPVMDQSPDYKWTDLLRPAYFVPENKKINDLLKEFRERKIHIAVIVDEYGGTSGLITLEDILEEIVGEIMDESDELGNELLYTRKDENTFIFEGKISLNDFCKIINADESIFDDVRGEADSLAGLLLELEGEIPSKNKEIKYSNFVFTIEAVDKRRIKLIKVHILNDKSS